LDLRVVEPETGEDGSRLVTQQALRRLPRLKFYVRPRWILLVVLVPFIVLGILVVLVKAEGLIRYDAGYFTGPYLERYKTPGDVVRELETALQGGDAALLAELEAQRWPKELETSPGITFVMLWERTDHYITYLYVDKQDYERHPQHIEFVAGRYVVAPEDLRYYLYSGEWKRVFLPLAAAWWILGFVATGLVWALRASEGLRARLYGA
jgi:hypothetical protein